MIKRYTGTLLTTILISILFCSSASALILQGKVVSEKGELLGYASVSIVGTTIGVVVAENGEFSLNVPGPGTYKIQVRSLGYKTLFEELTLHSDLRGKVFTLAEEALSTEQVMVTASGKDPAYGIIRKAIAHKKANENAVKAFSVDAYTKTTVNEKIKKEMLYLSENFSTLYVQKPDHRREVIHKSRVSGNSKDYDGIGALFFNLDPYKNLIRIPTGLREFISPIADNAFFFYDFHYLGNFVEKGKSIYKIELLPKRRSDPIFNGTVYIADENFSIKGLDWVVTSREPINYLDSIRFQQDYLPLNDSVWLQFNNQISGYLKTNLLLKKYDIYAHFLNIYSNYRITDPSPTSTPKVSRPFVNQRAQQSNVKRSRLPLTQTKRSSADSVRKANRAVADSMHRSEKLWDEMLKIEKTATSDSRNNAVWDSIRPVPLDTAEQHNFHKGDSVETRMTTKAYKDSVNQKHNRLKPIDLLTGYTYTNLANENTLSFSLPITSIQFNTIEGWNLQLSADKHWNLAEKKRYFNLGLDTRYGFASGRLSYRLRTDWLLNNEIREHLSLTAGDYPVEFSNVEQISPELNTIYSLYQVSNYLKLYQNQGGKLTYSRRLSKDHTIDLFASFHHRESLTNHTRQTWYPREGVSYTPNFSLPNSFSTELGLRFHLNFSTRYFTTPDGTFYIPSHLPHFVFTYIAGQAQNAQFTQTYQRLELQVSGGWDLKLLGQSRWLVHGGKLLGPDTLLLPDRFQVQGNRTAYRFSDLEQFGILNYYRYTSSKEYMEEHFEHDFQGFFLNKIPLLRRLKMHEVAGLHAVQMPGLTPHTELLVGLGNIPLFGRFGLFRINFHYELTGENPGRKGLTFAIGILQ